MCVDSRKRMRKVSNSPLRIETKKNRKELSQKANMKIRAKEFHITIHTTVQSVCGGGGAVGRVE